MFESFQFPIPNVFSEKHINEWKKLGWKKDLSCKGYGWFHLIEADVGQPTIIYSNDMTYTHLINFWHTSKRNSLKNKIDSWMIMVNSSVREGLLLKWETQNQVKNLDLL